LALDQYTTIAVTGISGQVGSALHAQQSDIQPVFARFTHDMAPVISELNAIRPQRLINAAAFTQVDRAETDLDTSQIVNTDAPSRLAKWCRSESAVLIHFSTDYVFDGQAKRPYVETDPPAPLNVYGATKYAGELQILDSACHGLVLRTSWVLGRGQKNFVTTILRAGLERNQLQVVNDQYGRPTSADLLAKIALEAPISRNQSAQILHVTDSGEPTNWFDIASYALNRARDFGYRGLDASNIEPIASASYPQAAKRPMNSLLDCSLFDRTIGIARRPWQDTVDAVVASDVSNW
jgi:dTDP-4-dehydrorhamnose reductase